MVLIGIIIKFLYVLAGEFVTLKAVLMPLLLCTGTKLTVSAPLQVRAAFASRTLAFTVGPALIAVDQAIA